MSTYQRTGKRIFFFTVFFMAVLLFAGKGNVQAKRKSVALNKTTVTAYKGMAPVKLKVKNVKKGKNIMAKRLFTSESVTEGHPDKICDQISDAVLDAMLERDPMSRVACETTVTTGLVHVMGEITTNCYVDIPKIARQVIKDIGYDRAKFGFDCDTCAVITSIDEQSPDIAMGVNKGLEAKEGTMDDGLDNG